MKQEVRKYWHRKIRIESAACKNRNESLEMLEIGCCKGCLEQSGLYSVKTDETTVQEFWIRK